MALFHAEVAGQAAAPGQHGHRGPGRGQQRPVRAEAHHGVVVAVRLDDQLSAGQVRAAPGGPGPSGGGAVSSSARVRVAAATAAARGSSGSRSTRSDRSTAVHDGSRPTIGMPCAA